MLHVIAQDFIKVDAIEAVLPLYQELIAATKQEPQCIAYDLHIDQNDPGHFIFIEQWPDQAALDSHCNSEHFQRLVPMIKKYQRKASEFILMDPF